MRFLTTPGFERDVRRLSPGHRAKLLEALPKFGAAADKAATGASNPWPKGLRVKRVVGTDALWEFTWSMNDPDGRATWQWATQEDEPAVLLRRAGDHAVLKRP